MVVVSDHAEGINGTSADIQEGDSFTVEQLLYGLMLPSGNDAAIALAEHFGQIILDDLEGMSEEDFYMRKRHYRARKSQF